MNLRSILKKEGDLSKNELLYLIQLKDEDSIKELHWTADKMRQKICGEEVHLRGVIKFSNNCEDNCKYCGLREENFLLNRYRMDIDEILDAARQVSNLGIRSIVLMSGHDTFYDTDLIAHLIYSIKQKGDTAVTLALGERGFDEYKTWRIAGADRYLLKFETSNRDRYFTYHSQKQLKERISHLKFLQRTGFEIETGNLIGFPDQTLEDIADDLILIKKLGVDTAVIGQFIPAPSTPFQNEKQGCPDLISKIISIARIYLQCVHISAPLLLDKKFNADFEKGLLYGADVLMPDYTPSIYKLGSSINFSHKDNYQTLMHSQIRSRIQSIHRRISPGKGSSIKSKMLSA